MEHDCRASDQLSWDHLAELFKLRENLITTRREGQVILENVDLEAVESKIYEALWPRVQLIVHSKVQGQMPEDIQTEIINDAMYKLFAAYGRFQGRSSLKTYFENIVRNHVVDCLKKQSADRKLFIEPEAALPDPVDPRGPTSDKASGLGGMDAPENAFELIQREEQALSDLEFVAITMRAACTLMSKKMSDTELANRLGIPRTTFIDALKRARRKIQSWKQPNKRDTK